MTSLKTLRELRDATPGKVHAYPPNAGCEAFYRAAHAALGENGCITRELEALHNEIVWRDDIIMGLRVERGKLNAKYRGLEQLFEGARETTRQDRSELSALRTQHEALVKERDSAIGNHLVTSGMLRSCQEERARLRLELKHIKGTP